jgi:hypothetical protein
MVPRYKVPVEILDLAKKGVFHELTQDGDPARSFGLVGPTGYEARLWVDRERYGDRKMTGFHYIVTGSDAKGALNYETSHDSLQWALWRWEELVERPRFRGGPKEWSPLKHDPKRGIYEREQG